MPLTGIQKLVLDDLEERNPTEEEIQQTLKELKEHRGLKTKGARATNFAAAQDLKNTMLHIDIEVISTYSI